MSAPASITPRETVVQSRTCAGGLNPTPCGQTVDVKLNKNGIAYYYCAWCNHHQKWGREDSTKLIQMYLKSRKSEAGKVQNIVTKKTPTTATKEPLNVKTQPAANINASPDAPRHWLVG